MANTPLKLAIAGRNGRLGLEIINAIQNDPELILTLGLDRKNGELSAAHPNFDVMIDVSTCDGVLARLPVIQEMGKPLVIGVTGFSSSQREQIRTASRTVPILLSGNFSIGVGTLLRQVRTVAKNLGPKWIVSITETHHTNKKDHPSGTALMLAHAVQDGFGLEIPIKTSLSLQDPVQTSRKHIAIHSLRKEGVIGQHDVVFSNKLEEVVLGHTAHSRAIFASGALVAAQWLADKTSGFYEMGDVLGD